jgi:predicted transcriptional regulator
MTCVKLINNHTKIEISWLIVHQKVKPMNKEVQMSIKMEPELRDKFMAAASTMHRPAAQIMRDLMRLFIASQGLPNVETIAAIQAVERGEFTTHDSTTDLYRTLGI